MIPRVAKLGTGFVGAGMYYMHDKREDNAQTSANARPSAAEYFLTDKGPAQFADRVGFTQTRNLSSDDPMAALRQMAFTAAHAHEIRVAAVTAAAKAAGTDYDAYVKATNPFRGRKGTKPVYSMSLSFPPNDPHATKANMIKAADEVRHVLGLKDHQCVIIQHTDTKHPHVHLIINRVHPKTGKFASVSNDRMKLSAWAHDWEQRHGKIVCPERPHNQDRRRANAARKQTARRGGDLNAKSGYVKNTGLPPSEIAFWNEHGSANLQAVRAVRSEYQKRDYEKHKRITERKLANVDVHHQAANGSTLRRIDRTLRVLTGKTLQRATPKASSVMDVMFGAVRGAALGVVARIANRSDIAKLEKVKTQLRAERDVRRAEVMRERRQAFQKMQRIHAWQNWLDEKRCKTYRESDTRDYRSALDRWDMGKLKPPLFGTVIAVRYDVEESKNWRLAAEDRHKMTEPLEMKPIKPDAPSADPALPRGPSLGASIGANHARADREAMIAQAARKRSDARHEKPRKRSTGRKRRPRPR
ncbi:MAG: relaxase/mobilization nuclease domain-containing protein [Pseudomonadota bacterium]